MILFEGNDAFMTTEYMIDCLREIAKNEAKVGEYNPAEHTNWIAADMIELLVDMALGEKPSLLLKEITRWVESREGSNTHDST